MSKTTKADTIEVDKELLERILALVAFPPEKRNAARCQVPWAWVEEVRGMLDAGDGRIGPRHAFDWLGAHLVQKRNEARRDLERAEAELVRADDLGIMAEAWSDEHRAATAARRVEDCTATVKRRRAELERLERRIAEREAERSAR